MSTLKVDTILKRSGTGTITLKSGETHFCPTGASIALQGGSNGQALTTNSPAFFAYCRWSYQAIF